jgi:hypothetical protein
LRHERSPQPRDSPQELCTHRDAPSSTYDDDNHSSHSRSPPSVKAKGKQRAHSRSPSPSRKSCILRAALVAPREQERFTVDVSTSLLHHKSSAHNASGENNADSTFRTTPESYSEGSPVTSSSQSCDESPSAGRVTHTTDNTPLPSEGLCSLITSSPSSMPEKPEPLSSSNRPIRANPARQPRYRNQRDSIIAYLWASSSTTPRPPPSAQLKYVPSLLARMTDETVAGLEGLEANVNITGGKGEAEFMPRSPEQCSLPSAHDDDDDASWKNETPSTKVELHGGSQHNCEGQLPSRHERLTSPSCHLESEEAPHRSSRVYLLNRLNVEKTIAREARLRTQARLRARLAAERQLAQDKW